MSSNGNFTAGTTYQGILECMSHALIFADSNGYIGS
jgi:hypothetical protein